MDIELNWFKTYWKFSKSDWLKIIKSVDWFGWLKNSNASSFRLVVKKFKLDEEEVDEGDDEEDDEEDDGIKDDGDEESNEFKILDARN